MAKQYENYLVAYCNTLEDCSFDVISDLYDKLPQFFKKKVDTHKFNSRRRNSVLVYSLLSELLGYCPDEFIYNSFGEPFLFDGSQFSVSYSKNPCCSCIV
ncbi:MAG: hypothetical protein LBP35_03475 [Candidatus Ancillula trichonymphae]|nr:hypothetical protein [Candidatus Ancillula trichonymphae]